MISYHKSLVKIAWEESRTTAHGTHTKLNPYQNQYGLNLINFTDLGTRVRVPRYGTIVQVRLAISSKTYGKMVLGTICHQLNLN